MASHISAAKLYSRRDISGTSIEAKDFGMTHMTHPNSRQDIHPSAPFSHPPRRSGTALLPQHIVKSLPPYREAMLLGRSGPRILSKSVASLNRAHAHDTGDCVTLLYSGLELQKIALPMHISVPSIPRAASPPPSPSPIAPEIPTHVDIPPTQCHGEEKPASPHSAAIPDSTSVVCKHTATVQPTSPTHSPQLVGWTAPLRPPPRRPGRASRFPHRAVLLLDTERSTTGSQACSLVGRVRTRRT